MYRPEWSPEQGSTLTLAQYQLKKKYRQVNMLATCPTEQVHFYVQKSPKLKKRKESLVISLSVVN